MIHAALVGLGKMGLSHLAIANSHPEIKLTSICDANRYVTDTLGRHTAFKVYNDYLRMLDSEKLDAVFIATPSKFHADMVREALERDLHVFCEKPFCLDSAMAVELTRLAESKSLVGQVGYHYRFAGTFRAMRDALNRGTIGKVHHIRAEAFGPVVLRSSSSTWRSQKNDGGGCLYDYACHAVDLLHYMVGPVGSVSGTVLNTIFSESVEDEVYSTLRFDNGVVGQVAANWSDESHRKMSMKVMAWGSNGRISADRQEVQFYIRDPQLTDGATKGWSLTHATEIEHCPWYYLRGEEYSNQIDHFVRSIMGEISEPISTFASASRTDAVLNAMVQDALDQKLTSTGEAPFIAAGRTRSPNRSILSRLGI